MNLGGALSMQASEHPKTIMEKKRKWELHSCMIIANFYNDE
jgi:hypothetical protein